MMKKVLSLLLMVILVFGLTACAKEAAKPAQPATYEIAMITDLGTIDDKSFNQGTWEGIVAYADKSKLTHKYYKPTEQSTDAYLAAIQLAVDGGAKVIVTPGFLFEEPIFKLVGHAAPQAASPFPSLVGRKLYTVGLHIFVRLVLQTRCGPQHQTFFSSCPTFWPRRNSCSCRKNSVAGSRAPSAEFAGLCHYPLRHPAGNHP